MNGHSATSAYRPFRLQRIVILSTETVDSPELPLSPLSPVSSTSTRTQKHTVFSLRYTPVAQETITISREGGISY